MYYITYLYIKDFIGTLRKGKTFCKQHGVKLTYVVFPFRKNTAFANSTRNTVFINPFTLEYGLLPVLYHEMGHIKHEHGVLTKKKEYGVSSIILVEECAAWIWAFENMPSDLHEEAMGVMVDVLSSYFNAYYISNSILPSEMMLTKEELQLINSVVKKYTTRLNISTIPYVMRVLEKMEHY